MQLASQSRVSYEGRPDFSGFCAVRPWNPPRMEVAQPLWTTSFSILTVHTVTVLLIFSSNLSFQFLQTVSHTSTMYFHISPIFILFITSNTINFDQKKEHISYKHKTSSYQYVTSIRTGKDSQYLWTWDTEDCFIITQ